MSADAVLLMAYGSPDRLDQVADYYTDIRRGSPPPPELLDELLERYRAIGGGSPLSRIVEAQRAALELELAARGRPVRVYAGMRHIEPRIGRIVERMAADGVTRFVAIALAPQASSNAAGYRRAVDGALVGLGAAAPTVSYVESWHDQPRFIEALAETTREAIGRFPDPERGAGDVHRPQPAGPGPRRGRPLPRPARGHGGARRRSARPDRLRLRLPERRPDR